MKAKIRLIITTLVILLVGGLPGQVFAEDYTASTMRLLRHEGTVEITDASGKKRAVLENVRFSSGEAMATGKESTASVGLDSDKVVTMDELSRVEFKKKANNMELTLTDGQLLLDVQKKLDKEEKLDVRTSTMTIGIRGTVIYLDTGSRTGENASAGESASPTPAADNSSTAVSSDTGSKASEETTRLGVLEGTVEVIYVDVNGKERTIKVPAGNKLTLTDANRDGMADIEPVTEELESIDFNAFLLKQISNNPDLKERLILLDSLKEALNPEESVYKTEITLVAQSASKLYDGIPLTRTGDVLVYGLPEKFTVKASAGGSITDAGSASNPISSYAIFDANGTNVTSKFTNVKTVDGQLVVDRAPVTVWTGSAEKVYDGQPLTNAEGGLGNYPVHEKDAPLWRNLSYVTIDKEQNFQVQTLYGICGTVYVYGTNPLTGENQEIALRAGQKLTVWLSDKDDEQSIEYEITDVSEEELPDEVLQIYADNSDVLAQACIDTAWNQELMRKLIDEFMNSDKNIENVSTNNMKGSAGGMQFAIDGNSASGNNSGGMQYTGDSSRKNAGSLRCTVPANNAVQPALSGNMPSVKRLGMSLTASDRKQSEHTSRYDVQIIRDFADSLIKDSANVRINIDTTITDYNNRPLGSEESRFTEIAVDPSIVVTATGSQTEVGESLNTYSIDWGNANPANYILSENLGTLKVTAADNTRPRPNVRSTRGGFRPTNPPIPTNTPKPTDTPTPKPTNTPTPKPTNTSTPKPTNTPTPTPIPSETPTYDMKVTFTAGSKSKTYDGTPLTDKTVTVTGLPDDFTYEVVIDGEQTDEGKSTNKLARYYIYKDGEDVTSQFTNVTTVNGTLTVNPLPVTFNLYLFEAIEYSGEPICPEWIEGYYDDASPVEYVDDSIEYIETDGIWTATSGLFNLIGGGQVYLRANGVRDVGNHTIKPTAEFRAGKAKNYTISYEGNTVNITPLELIVKTGTKSKEYDGTPLTDPTITLEGLTEVDEGKVTASATGTITNVGDTPNTYVINWGSVNPANYDITEELGTLTVTQRLGLVPDDSLTGASSTLSGVNLLNPDTVKRILNYFDPVTPGTPVNHINETDPSGLDNGSPASQDSSESNADSSASISPTAKPGTSPTAKPDPTAEPGTSPMAKPDPTAKPDTDSAVTDDSDVSAVHESGIVPPSDDSRVSDPEIPENTESGSTSGSSDNADSSVSQTDSSSQAGDSTNAVSTADSSLALPISEGN
ncbi:MAG: FecR domain-containing protein [Lachnospiraceae bacterium]|nr:FecR domain-containing protein [Lachnospiraceae bacterium]